MPFPPRRARAKARTRGSRRGKGWSLPRLPRLRWPSLRLPTGLRWPGLGIFGLARSWARLHVQTLVGSLGRLAGQPIATAMTMAVIGIALALPAGLHLLVTNIQGLSGHWDDSIELSVYLAPGQPEARARELALELGGWNEIADTLLVTADEALERFRQDSDFGTAMDALDTNPLPHLVVIRPARGHEAPEAVEALAERLRALPEADLVQADADWVRRLFAMLEIARRLAMLAAFLLVAGVLIIVGNTIRLDIQNRRDEIEVTKLVGGTDGFIRRPLLYGGTWYGLGGGIVAVVLVQLGLLALSGPVERLAGLYGSGFNLSGLGWSGAAGLALAGAALGWLGSWVSATRHLRRIEPGL